MTQRGLASPRTKVPEPELSIGNIVRLKKPWRELHNREYRWGIIVQHAGMNFMGHPKVSLHLFDERGRLLIEEGKRIPEYADFVASEFVVWKIASQLGYEPLCNGQGFDMYPTCQACRGSDEVPIGGCDACGGWGYSMKMQRLPRETRRRNERID
jgi:hypothetical protein